MSTYILMKILESAPGRYDRGIRILTLGKLDAAYDRVTSHIESGQKVLDIGCGTGALALRAARRGAEVKGIDVNARMLEIARERAVEAGLARKIEWREMGVAELGSEESESYDVVMSGLCFSELTEGELTYALKEIPRILKPGGLLLVADEAMPESVSKRFIHRLVRFPLVMVTYLVARATTSPVRNLPEKIEAAGLSIESVRASRMENFIEVAARK